MGVPLMHFLIGTLSSPYCSIMLPESSPIQARLESCLIMRIRLCMVS